MTLCAPDRAEAIDQALGSPSSGIPKAGARLIGSLTDWMIERKQELGSYSYSADMKKTVKTTASSTCSRWSTW